MITVELQTACGASQRIPLVEERPDVHLYVHTSGPIALTVAKSWMPRIDGDNAVRVYTRRFTRRGHTREGLPLYVEDIDPKINPVATISADLLEHVSKHETEAITQKSLASYWEMTARGHAKEVQRLTTKITHEDVVG